MLCVFDYVYDRVDIQEEQVISYPKGKLQSSM